MGKIAAFLKSLLLAAAILTAALLGFFGIKKGIKAKPETSSMKKIIKFLKSPAGIAAIIILVAVICAGIFILIKKLAGPPPEPEIAATVNGENVPYQDYKTRYEAQTYFYAEIDPRSPEELVQIQNQVIEDMVQEKLLTQELAKHDVEVTYEEVRQRIKDEVVDPYFHEKEDPWQAYNDTLDAHYHTTLEEVTRTFRLELLRENLEHLATKKHAFGIWIYKNAVAGDPERRILEKMSVEETNEPKKQIAEELFEKIKSGEDISMLAREFSEDEESATRGGDLGLIIYPTSEIVSYTVNTHVENFPGLWSLFRAVRDLNTGEIELYEQFNGYLIVKITDVIEGPIDPGQDFDKWYGSLRSKAEVSIEESLINPGQ